jgi:CubicO group peptidase (beta-lactamase class C family)
MRTIRTALLLTLGATFAFAQARPAWPPRGPVARAGVERLGFDPDGLAAATDLLRQYVAEHKIAGAVAAVARRGELAYLEAVGVQDLASRTPMTADSLFRIYSMSKAVTSIAVMQFVERGRVQLDDPVSKYLPEFAQVAVRVDGGASRPPARPVSVRDLLLHTSGLNHRTSPEYQQGQVRQRGQSLPQFVSNVVRFGLMEDPGTRYRYSEGTSVLGRLIEVWSGETLDRYLESRIFRPLGMNDTSFWATAAQRARLTTAYRTAATGGLEPVEIEAIPFTERPPLLEGAVGLLSTVPDFLRFSQMLLNRGELDGVRVLESSTTESLVVNGLSEAVQRARGGTMGWGLGNVNVVLDPARLNYPAQRGEYGWDGTAGTIFWIDPGRQLVTILMTQSVPANPDGIRQKFKTLVERAVVN